MNEIINAADMFGELKAYREKMDKAFVYTPEDGYLTINISYAYNIHMDRIKTQADLLCWVYHLTEKNWMNMDYIREFIEVVCKIKGWHCTGA